VADTYQLQEREDVAVVDAVRVDEVVDVVDDLPQFLAARLERLEHALALALSRVLLQAHDLVLFLRRAPGKAADDEQVQEHVEPGLAVVLVAHLLVPVARQRREAHRSLRRDELQARLRVLVLHAHARIKKERKAYLEPDLAARRLELVAVVGQLARDAEVQDVDRPSEVAQSACVVGGLDVPVDEV